MPRLLFSKTGEAVWISHLDLMRLFQRAFKRAGLPLTHTQGYNPRPSVSIALPLSVGVESCCELLDFDLEGESCSCDEVASRLNAGLVKGVEVQRCYPNGRKVKELAFLSCSVFLEYDSGIPSNAEAKICNLFASETLIMEKKGKYGIQQQDIIPMIRSLEMIAADANTLILKALICCQNPSLNPMQLPAAIERYLPDCKPDFARCRREELYDVDSQVFR